MGFECMEQEPADKCKVAGYQVSCGVKFLLKSRLLQMRVQEYLGGYDAANLRRKSVPPIVQTGIVIKRKFNAN